MGPGRRVLLLGAAIVSLLTVAGCADTGNTSRPSASNPSTSTAVQVAPSAFERVVADSKTFTVNVHVPDAGSIEGTDAAIPYDTITEQAAKLPQDRSTPIAVYCLTGRMSALAVPVLLNSGYTDVIELSGGMEAWTASGRPFLPASE